MSSSTPPSNQEPPPGLVLNLDHDLNRLAIREALQAVGQLERHCLNHSLSRDLVRGLCHRIGLRLSYFLLHSAPHALERRELALLHAHYRELSQALQRSQASDSTLSGR